MEEPVHAGVPAAGLIAAMAAVAALVAFAAVAWAGELPEGDPARGKRLFNARCVKCHEDSTMGPPYTALIGRRAGTVKGFEYSDALQKAGIDWSEASLDRWLADPDEFVPGNLMGTRVRRAQDRADLIAYLKQRN